MLVVAARTERVAKSLLDRTLKERGVDDAVRNPIRPWLMQLRWQCGGVVE